ncbi:MAG: F0F1 ATP synthase subunit delta [Pseudomarimonas sp.]
MSTNVLTLARPYARAAFAIAKEHGRLRPWSSLLGFAAAVAADPQAKQLLGHPGIGSDTLIGLLLPAGEVDPNFQQFLSVLADNRRLTVLPDIAALFEQLRREAEGVVAVAVTSATAMSDAELEGLAVALRKRFSREVAMSHRVDPELIGGAIIDAGDVVIDGSLRSKLARLQIALAS